MTLNEFRAWLDGFDASIEDAPSVEQWETIKAKLATVVVVSLPGPSVHSLPQWSPAPPNTSGIMLTGSVVDAVSRHHLGPAD